MIRSLIRRLHDLSAWQFVVVAASTLGVLRAAWGIVGLKQNEGAFELLSILRFVAFVGLLLLLVRRRQFDAWSTAIQGAVIVITSELLALLLMLDFLPRTLPNGESVVFMSLAGIGVQSIVAALAVPLGAVLIWASRYRRRGSLSTSSEPPSSAPPSA